MKKAKDFPKTNKKCEDCGARMRAIPPPHPGYTSYECFRCRMIYHYPN